MYCRCTRNSLYFLLGFALTVVVMISLTGCSSAKLVQDPSIPAIKANYPTAEMQACGKRWHGLGTCALKKGEPLQTVNFQVQGYYRGTITVESKTCQVSQTVSYENNALVPFSIPGLAAQSCTLSVTVSPEYPKRKDETVVVYSFRGHVHVRVHDGNLWQGFTGKVAGQWQRTLKVKAGGQGKVRVMADGCDVKYDQQLDLISGVLDFPLHDAVLRGTPKYCVLSGAVLDPQYEDFLFTAFVAQYDSSFAPLAIPALQVDGDKLHVTAENAVSVVAFDEEFIIGQGGKFKWDQNKVHIIRLLTTAGRSVIGEYTPSGGWKWSQ